MGEWRGSGLGHMCPSAKLGPGEGASPTEGGGRVAHAPVFTVGARGCWKVLVVLFPPRGGRVSGAPAGSRRQLRVFGVEAQQVRAAGAVETTSSRQSRTAKWLESQVSRNPTPQLRDTTVNMCAHTHACALSCVCTYVHAHSHMSMCVHAWAHACLLVCAHAYAHMCACLCVLVSAHLCVFMYTHVCSHLLIRVCVCVLGHVCVCSCAHTHACMSMCVLVYTCTRVCLHVRGCACSCVCPWARVCACVYLFWVQ